MDEVGVYQPMVLWRLGDPWRRLDDELKALPEPVTVVTKHGSARIMSWLDRWQQRIPLEGGHAMLLDLEVQPLVRLDATCCGISTLDGLGGFHKTARVILVLRGEHPRWLLSEVGRQTFMKVRTEGWAAEGHPKEPCGALRCVRLR